MSETAAEQLRRILHLIPQIADGDEHLIDALAAQLGVDESTLRDDITSLTDRFGDPGGFVEGVSLFLDDRYLSARTSDFLRPMRLTMRELCALELGLAMLRLERSPDEHAPIDRALARIHDAITKVPTNAQLEGAFAADATAPGAEHLPAIRSALDARRKLALDYRAGAVAETTARTVRPYGLVFSAGMWYLVAHCERSDGLRRFRLDRVERADAIDERFTIPDSFSLDEMLAGRALVDAPDAGTMTVRYGARVARWIAEREGRSVDADGSITLEHRVADRRWALRHVLQYGDEAEIIAPESLRQEMRRTLGAL
jgi:proteasome accessory factor C